MPKRKLKKRKVKKSSKVSKSIKKNKRKIKGGKNKKTVKFLIILISFCLATFIFLMLIYKNIKIKTINCYIDGKDCSSENIVTNQDFYNQNIFSLSPQSVSQYYLNTYPYIFDVTLKKRPLKTIDINLTKRQVFAQLMDRNGQYFFVDENGMVIKKAYNSHIPIIITQNSFEIGSQICSPIIIAAIDLLSLMENSYISVKTIELLEEDGLEIKLNSSQTVYFNSNKNLDKQVDSLQFILQNSTIEKDQKISVIDLRYDTPIVK